MYSMVTTGTTRTWPRISTAIRSRYPVAPESLLETLVIEGLHEVVDGRDIEGIEGVAVIGRHENRRRHVFGPDVADDFEAGPPRHLHIQKHEVGFERANGLDGRIPVVREAGDRHAFLVAQQ